MSLPILVALLWAVAQDDSGCLLCHGEEESGAPFVAPEAFGASAHGANGCASCHADVTEYPHPDEGQPASCAACHSEEAAAHGGGVHATAAACADCHGAHDVRRGRDRESRVFPLNLPTTCGRCHAEILETYAERAHGRGLLRSGLLVSASCTDCHGSHAVLPPGAPGSPLARERVPETCGRCHLGIAEALSASVHTPARGPDHPVCTDCHATHGVRAVEDPEFRAHIPEECGRCHATLLERYRETPHGRFVAAGRASAARCSDCHGSHRILSVEDPASPLSGANRLETCRHCHPDATPEFAAIEPHARSRDAECLDCHADPRVGNSLHVDPAAYDASVHGHNGCGSCHPGVRPEGAEECREARPRCGVCHAQAEHEYAQSIHGRRLAEGDAEVAKCSDCHGAHGIVPVGDPHSAVFPFNLPGTCGRCHGNLELTTRHEIPVPEAYQQYLRSVHGRGLLGSGLLFSATCKDCHGVHAIRAAGDPLSPLRRSEVPRTCGRCHAGILAQYSESIHGAKLAAGDASVPVCTDCHPTHEIARTAQEAFQLGTVSECGSCHEDRLKTYKDTYHGKVATLGFAVVARCSDCHEAHGIQPESDPRSSVSPSNRAATCRRCHPAATESFAQFQPHADARDRRRYPLLYWVWILMSLLLISVFGFAGVHTLAWLGRSAAARRRAPLRSTPEAEPIYQRIVPFHRWLHGFVIVSFLGLAATGLPLKFSDSGWSRFLAHLFGGFETAGYIHRVCAVITFGYFGAHLGFVLRFLRRRRREESLLKFLFGPESMIPRPKDLKDLWAHAKWFVGAGPQPPFDRFTYWEKFDYWAVFWGVAVIGASGLVMWFPGFFTRFLPGWAINVALMIHSEEALLATGFIFAVHFFNNHLRPGKFPLDPVVFTGRVRASEWREERPLEWARLVESGRLRSLEVAPNPGLETFARVVGIAAWTVGTLLLLGILWSALA